MRVGSYDVTPSILNHKIPLSTTELPNAKRPKLPAPYVETSIASLIDSDAYGSIEDLSRDLDAVISSVTSEIESQVADSETSNGIKIRPERHPVILGAVAFKQEFNNIISQELMSRPYLADPVDSKDKASIIKEELDTKSNIKSIVGDDEGGTRHNTVLTLFGGSGQPKQLFSSLKESGELQTPGAEYRSSRISEVGLPNGINFVKIIPVHSEGGQGSKKEIPNIGKLFAPPPGIPALNPPRQSRHTATRSSSVNWYNPVEATTPSRPSLATAIQLSR